MPSKFQITREDILRSKTVDPGWYKGLVKNVVQKAAKTDKSTNTEVHFILQDAGAFSGIPVTGRFSEKAPGFAINFVAALLGENNIGEEGGEWDFDRAIGKTIEIMVVNDMYDGRLTNKVVDYRAIQS